MSIEKIVQHYFPGKKLMNNSRPKGGISADITIVELADQQRQFKVVIRQTPSAENEFKLLTSLQTSQILAPKPLILDTNGRFSPSPYLILEHIDGTPLYHFKQPAIAGALIGAQLAAIHAIQLDPDTLPFLKTNQVNLPPATGSLREQPLRDLLEPLWPLPNSGRLALLHGDFWPGNLLWKDGALTGVIDWEDALFGNPLHDLAISRFDTLFILGRPAFDALTQAYSAIHPINKNDEAQLAYWDLFSALRAASGIPQWATGWPSLGRPDLTEQAINRSLNWFIQQALVKIG